MKATIAVINQKGGVGKSTTAYALGAGLSLKSYRVLYIDLDAQGNLSDTLKADNTGLTGLNSLEVLTGTTLAINAIQHTDQGDIIASSPALSGADTILTTVGKEYCLKEALALLESTYDYIVIDTPPALGILTVNALTACTSCLIPAQADVYSLQGINQLYGTIQTVRKYCNPSLQIMGILLTRYSARAIISRDVSEMMDEIAKQLHTQLYTSKIRECTALKEAQAVKQSIYSYAPKSNAAIDYSSLINEMLGKE